MRRVLLLCLILLLGETRAAANELPLFTGGLSGDFRVKALSGAPPIQWHVDAVAESATENRITLSAHARGLKVKARVSLPRDGSPGSWRILEGHLIVSDWWAILINSGLVVQIPKDIQLTGELQFAGAGNMDDAHFTGELSAKLVGGSMSSRAQGWSVQRMDFEAVLNLAEEGPVIESLSLSASQAVVQGFVLENLEVSAVGAKAHQLRINTATVELLGGRVGLRPFAFDLTKPEMLAKAELEGVSLAALSLLMPKALSAAQGRLSGTLEIGWSAALGLQPGTGTLRVTRDSSSTLRLAATPNFLTQHIGKKIEWLPAMFGSLARKLALDNPAYETLRQIEMGEMALAVDSLDVALYPDGRDGQVSARVAVVARPEDGHAVEEVSFEINVTGPLKEVLLLSTDKRMKLGVKSK